MKVHHHHHPLVDHIGKIMEGSSEMFCFLVKQKYSSLYIITLPDVALPYGFIRAKVCETFQKKILTYIQGTIPSDQ